MPYIFIFLIHFPNQYTVIHSTVRVETGFLWHLLPSYCVFQDFLLLLLVASQFSDDSQLELGKDYLKCARHIGPGQSLTWNLGVCILSLKCL